MKYPCDSCNMKFCNGKECSEWKKWFSEEWCRVTSVFK